MNLFEPSSFTQPSYAIHIHEITSDHFEIERLGFDFINLPPAGNHGLCFDRGGKRYALTGDSHFHAQEIAFLSGVDLAIIDSGHLEDEQIVHLAAQSQARVIVCSHLYREIDAPRLQAWAEREGYTGTILVGHDLMSFEL
jgi:ribonuclease BN (tRNA processing enzyme)